MFETLQKLLQWLPTLPAEAKIPITISIVCLAAFFIVMLWYPSPSNIPKVSPQQIRKMLNEIDNIQQDWNSRWQEVEPLAERARVYIGKRFPEQAANIESAQKTYTNVSDVAKVLKTQLQIVNDHLQK
jgi:predicted PurR-regulated permease PerM